MMTKEQARKGLKALRRAVTLAGSPTALARALAEHLDNPKIKQAHVWNWLNRDKKVPPDKVLPLVEVCKRLAAERGEEPVYPHELRGDLYPEHELRGDHQERMPHRPSRRSREAERATV